jgi:hypothetical protein
MISWLGVEVNVFKGKLLFLVKHMANAQENNRPIHEPLRDGILGDST